MTKEEILQGFLSKDAHKIWSVSSKVIHSVITNRELIESLVPHLTEIKQATRNFPGTRYCGFERS